MQIHELNDEIIISGITDFDTTHTFMCGQCFRWDIEEDGSYTGVSHGRVVNIRVKDNDIIIKNSNRKDLNDIWIDYLDLNRNYADIKAKYAADIHLKKAMEFGSGIHILNQEIFECLISFIISTQNGIPRIKKIVSTLSEMYGDKINYNGKTYYSFPTPHQLQGITEKDLEPLKAGYRAAYIVDAVNKVLTGEVNLEHIGRMDTDAARNELLKIKGVGPKVADCVLLFSCKKTDAFPIDVWVQRIMRSLYCGESSTIKQIQMYAKENFGEFSGMAQQYLFYYARENSL